MNSYDYDEKLQAVDVQCGTNTAQTKKAPNIFKQLIYSVMPKKYGELAKVKVKGFIFYNLFWCFVMCIGVWVAAWIISFGESAGYGNIWVDDELRIIILISIGIGIPICLIMTIVLSVILATSYFTGTFVIAFIMKEISKKQCSMFDLYKSAVYCQTPANLAIFYLMVGDDNTYLLVWLILEIISLIILKFGIQNLPAKPFLPEKNQPKEESSQCSPENEPYKAEPVSQVSSTPSKPRVTPGYWRCSCGCENPSYTGTCSCGKSKY